MKASIVIPTHNRRSDLEECVRSLLNMDGPEPEIIVVDSCSNDGTEQLRRIYPIRYVSIPHRTRIRARNIGVSLAQGDIIAFLDDDTVVDTSWLPNLIEPYADPSVGGVGGRVIPYGRPSSHCKKIRHSVIGKVFKDGLVLGNFDMPTGPLTVDHLPGCNMSFRKEVLARVRGFDENFQGNCFRDDTDICLSARELGFRLLYNPAALLWHKFRGRGRDPEWTYWYVRNNTYFYFKKVFPLSRKRLFLFLYRQAFPPQDYVDKSGLEIKWSLSRSLLGIRGFVDGISLYRLHRRS